jgi:hypothetical protein
LPSAKLGGLSINATQLGALDTPLTHCARHIPYYRRLLREVGIPSAAKTGAAAARKALEKLPQHEH